MYNRNTIQNEFLGLVGLRQTDNPNFPKLGNKVVYDGTNVLVQHPLLNIENIDMCARNYAFFTFPAWNIANNYFVGDRVEYNGNVYESLTGTTSSPNVGNQPDTSPTEWELQDLLSLYLEDVFRTSIDDTVNEVFNKKKVHGQTKTLLQNQRLTSGVGGFTDTIVNDGSLVGVEFKLKHNNNIQAVIEKIGLQLTAANPALNLYIYHSSQLQPIATVVINHTSIGSFQWHKTGFTINHLSDDYDAGGVFYAMYDQNDLVGQAIKKKHNWHLPPCSYCNRRDVDWFNKYTKYLIIRTVRVKAADRNTTDDTWLWDLEKTQYVSDNNFGLNFEWTIKCDITNFIVNQKEVFGFALRDMVKKNLLMDLINTTRQNDAQEKVQVLARAELQSTTIGGMGMLEKLEEQLKAVDFEISALDDTCMPCNNKSGLRLGTAGLSW